MGKESGMASYVRNSQEMLTPDNYNEMDALIFAQLSYGKFETARSEELHQSGYHPDIIEYTGEMTVSEYVNILKQSTSLSDDEKALYTEIANSPRYQNCKITNFATETNDSSQWAAMTVKMNDDTSVIAYRGTDGTKEGWREDFEILRATEGTDAQRYSRDYLEHSQENNVFLTGHSKGGNDASAGYMMADDSARSRVLQIHNFDGPGNNEILISKYQQQYEELYDKLNNYYPRNSIIGQLLNNNPGYIYFVEAEVREEYKDKSILGEHDGFSFVYDGNGFVAAEQSEFSKNLDRLLDEALVDLPLWVRFTVIQKIEDMMIPELIAGDAEAILRKQTVNSIQKLIGAYDYNRDYIGSAALIYVAVNMLYHECERIIDKRFDEFCNEFKQKQIFVANWLKDKADYIEEKILDFTDSVMDICDNIHNYISKKFNLVHPQFLETFRKFFEMYNRGSGNMAMRINRDNLVAGAEQLCGYSTELMQLKSQIANVYCGMNASFKVLMTVGIWKIEYLLSKEAAQCRQMGNVLKEIERNYENTEHKITSAMGS